MGGFNFINQQFHEILWEFILLANLLRIEIDLAFSKEFKLRRNCIFLIVFN